MYKSIRNYIEAHMSFSRFEHSLSTSLLCGELCCRFGLNESKGRIAGIAHDIAREFSVNKITNILINDGYPLTDEDQKNPVLLHGRIGALIIEQQFGVKDTEILQAVRWHTTGHPDMGPLGQVLFIADYIEAGRSHIQTSFRESLMSLELNEITLRVLNDQSANLRERGIRIAHFSILLYNELATRKKDLKCLR